MAAVRFVLHEKKLLSQSVRDTAQLTYIRLDKFK